jgi:hypothetical protein
VAMKSASAGGVHGMFVSISSIWRSCSEPSVGGCASVVNTVRIWFGKLAATAAGKEFIGQAGQEDLLKLFLATKARAAQTISLEEEEKAITKIRFNKLWGKLQT